MNFVINVEEVIDIRIASVHYLIEINFHSLEFEILLFYLLLFFNEIN
jgi:hypothetical protein